MARTGVKKPRISVVLPVTHAGQSIARTIESIQNQSFREFELLVVEEGSSRYEISFARRAAEHDIRIEVLERSANKTLVQAGVLAARASQIMVMEAGDWIGPDFLQAQLVAEASSRPSVTVPAAEGLDNPSAPGLHVLVPERVSQHAQTDRDVHTRALPSRPHTDVQHARQAFMELIASGMLNQGTGVLMPAAAAQQAAEQGAADAFELLVAVAQNLDSLSLVHDARYNDGVMQRKPVRFDAELYGRCERHHMLLADLVARWDLLDDPATVEALHRHHLLDVISCIENACAPTAALTAPERRRLVQRMIDTASTRISIEKLRSSSREFGPMFGAIACRSVLACCMGAWIHGLTERFFTPFSLEGSPA
ncbi:glycosyltransferase family 2 protein [Collinsella sp. AGMB00827]|uniref:Glycosyltransferase family 2 protein n=1 Tax=Collinsella ureilytica TaxID=2869515 RepID=A0ABS7ML64_9ACTN|nr:glycosyltransferase family 2 protein [Collinsella urealyticum]